MMSADDAQWMRLALSEAAKGIARTSPNPPVGAVLVKNGRLLATGYHAKAGCAHAEMVALKKAGRRAQGATLYVTLEPCNHQGRTPPCTEAIWAAKISRVVIGTRDPNPQVKGRGLLALKKHRIKVAFALQGECGEFNHPYHIFATQKRPYVILKGAMSLDGMVATLSGESQWITSEAARTHAHCLRDRVDAILVGLGTVMRDDPRLTTRLGKKRGHDPIRVLVDSRLKVHPEAKVFKLRSPAPTFVFTTDDAPRTHQKALEAAGARVFRVAADPAGHVSLAPLLKELAHEGVMRLMVEGGPTLASEFVTQRRVDELHLYIAMKLLGKGISLLNGLTTRHLNEAVSLAKPRWEAIGEDLLVTAQFTLAGT